MKHVKQFMSVIYCPLAELNHRPSLYKSDALPTELKGLCVTRATQMYTAGGL